MRAKLFRDYDVTNLNTKLNDTLDFCQHSSMEERDSKSGVPDTLEEPVYGEIPEDSTINRKKMTFRLKNKKNLSKYHYRGLPKTFLKDLYQ